MDLQLRAQEFFDSGGFGGTLNLVRGICPDGNLWAVGGVVFRNIISEAKKDEVFDFDFIAEEYPDFEKVSAPDGWMLSKTGLGHIKLKKDSTKIEIFPLDHAVCQGDLDKISDMNNTQKLESYFRRVPLNVQAIAYDFSAKKLIGKLGMKAIKDMKIEVNNLNECISFCKRRRISIRHFIEEKSRSLGFRPVFPKFENESKLKTNRFYENYSEEYRKGEGYSSFILENLSEELNYFLKNLKGKKILDLGCGPGRDSLFFKSNGLEPVGVDLSESMVHGCERKGINAFVMDMENLDFDGYSFDGVWAYASLLHVPKERVFNVLAGIKELLTPEGLLFIGMVEGNSEKFYESKTKPGEKRFFSLYSDAEFRKILEEYFMILKFKRFESDKGTYLNYICKPNDFVYPF